jgi:hypothetical protein
MRKRLKVPSPAMAVAVAALVLAMVGTGYAAFKVPKKSVGTAQLKAKAVTNPKIKNGTITGKKLKLSSIGTVPNATHASVADTANALPAPELHVIGAPGQPGFEGGASNVEEEEGIGFTPAAFYKDHDGTVHLEGFIVPGTGPIAFVLPPGYRPASGKLQLFVGDIEEVGEEEIESGAILIAGSNVRVSGKDLSGAVIVEGGVGLLSGISFRAES